MEEKYQEVFRSVFELPIDHEVEKLEYQSITEWDSVGHMSLIARLEDEFSISLDIDDVIDFDGYVSGKGILQKYGVEL